jgi:tetratricopeptide (TPR) repeat protein
MSLARKIAPVAVAAATLWSGTSVGARDVSAVAADCGPAVVLITTFEGGVEAALGSGFVVEPDGTVVTNYHVIRGADRAKVKFTDGRHFNVKGVYAYDAARDVAVLAVPGKNLPTLTLGDSDGPAIGAAVVAIGNPQGFENTVSEGILSGRRELEGDQPFLQHTAPISPGSSGGPLLDTDGNVVGVNTLAYYGQNLNFAVPSNFVKTLLEKRDLQELAAVSGSVEGMSLAELTDHADYALRIGNLDEAETCYRKIIDEEPDLAAGYFGCGYVAYERDDYGESARFLKKGLEKDPREVDGHYYLGLAYSNLDKTSDALASFEEAYALAPYDAVLFRTLAYEYHDAGRYEEAIEISRNRLKDSAHDTDAMYVMGISQVQIGKPEDAKETFEKLLVIEPNAVVAHTGLGYAYLSMGKNGTAASEFEKTLTLRGLLDEDSLYEAFVGLGEARLAMGHHKKAREAFGEAVALKPDAVDGRFGLGRAYVEAGDLEAAGQEYEVLKGLDKKLAAELKEAIEAAEE